MAKSTMTEHDLQRTIRSTVNMTERFRAWIIDSNLVPYKGKMIRGIADNGVADIYVQCPDGRAVWMECKVGRNKQSKAQVAFQEAHEASGGTCCVVRTLGQALLLLVDHCERHGIQDRRLAGLADPYKKESPVCQ